MIDSEQRHTVRDYNSAANASGKPPVSFNNEQLVMVDSLDQVVGYSTKGDAHSGSGCLHRAFSVFLFDSQQRLLVHRRSEKKPLWPGFWTNSCCSHPRRGEGLKAAVHRRITEELGVTAAASRAYDFEYRASYRDKGTEHELCHVFLAEALNTSTLNVHEDEIMEWCWLSLQEVDALVRDRPEEVTPWFALEWQALRGVHAKTLQTYLQEIEDSRSAA
ncbi:MAG: isopentenyl-diphosphate Delta-isomerase [Congregibacter sp.]